jgi:putative peptidoglycan lipid II flippase
MLFITIPAMIALIALRVPIISVLFERGEFDLRSTILTAQALLCYAVGLWAFSTIRVVVAAFYALQDTKTPVRIAIVALVVNTVMSVLLMFPLKHGGLALATSIASAVNVVTLSVILARRIGPFLDREFYQSVLKVFTASFVMWGAIELTNYLLVWRDDGPFNERLTALTAAIAVGMATFFIASYLLKSREMARVLETVRRRLH